MTAHWGAPDPAAATGSEAEIATASNDACRMLGARIRLFLESPIASLDRMSLQARLRGIGESRDAAAPNAE